MRETASTRWSSYYKNCDGCSMSIYDNVFVPVVMKEMKSLQSFFVEFKMSEYPEHYKMGNSQTFAWRGAVLATIMEECQGPVVWLNSGVRIATAATIQNIRNILAVDGFIATSTYMPVILPVIALA